VPKILEQVTDEHGAPAIVRAYAKGEALEEAVRRGPLDLTTALRIIEQLLDALEMAHAHGILHGALSPTNVVVTPRGTVRLLDFATTPGVLARRSGPSGALAAARTGPFLAPERRSSPPGPATELSDVWGAGACLYFALAGTPLPDDPHAVRLAGVREEVTAIAALATARDPAARYESAYAMLGDIRRLLAGKKPLLDGSTGSVPSQRAIVPPPSSSGLQRLADDAGGLPSVPPSTGQWRGNVLLMLAIAVLVGLATFVLVRERLGDEPRFQPAAGHAASGNTP
jgi:serine/threonine protein kinase